MRTLSKLYTSTNKYGYINLQACTDDQFEYITILSRLVFTPSTTGVQHMYSR